MRFIPGFPAVGLLLSRYGGPVTSQLRSIYRPAQCYPVVHISLIIIIEFFILSPP